MMYQGIFFFILIVLASCSGDSKSRQAKNYLGASISQKKTKDFLIGKMEEYKIPGLSFGLINNGELVQHEVLGYADRESKLEVTTETIFEAASLSKPVFAYFVMTFVEEGILELDTPLHQY
ncbi:MAG: serine hydrolase domain-containing protein, partial [Bacteroidota bacterium]